MGGIAARQEETKSHPHLRNLGGSGHLCDGTMTPDGCGRPGCMEPLRMAVRAYFRCHPGRCGQSNMRFFSMRLQHPQQGLITKRALQMEDRMLAMIRPTSCQVRSSKAGG
jgi:hypothetical protein